MTFTDLADDAFSPIRQYGRSSALVTIRLLKTLAVMTEHVRTEEHRQTLLRHALMIERASREALSDQADRDEVEERYWSLLKILGEDRSLSESIARAGGFGSIIEQES